MSIKCMDWTQRDCDCHVCETWSVYHDSYLPNHTNMTPTFGLPFLSSGLLSSICYACISFIHLLWSRKIQFRTPFVNHVFSHPKCVRTLAFWYFTTLSFPISHFATPPPPIPLDITASQRPQLAKVFIYLFRLLTFLYLKVPVTGIFCYFDHCINGGLLLSRGSSVQFSVSALDTIHTTTTTCGNRWFKPIDTRLSLYIYIILQHNK